MSTTTKKDPSYRKVILTLLSSLDYSNMDKTITYFKEVEGFKRGLPYFLYRYPIFSSISHNKDVFIDDCRVQTSLRMTQKHLLALELIILKVNEQILGNQFHGEIGMMLLQEKVGLDYSDIIEDLKKVVITIGTGMDENISFHFLDILSKDGNNSKYKFVLSKIFTLIYLVDYVLPVEKYNATQEMFNLDITLHAIRSALCTPMAIKYGHSLIAVLKNIGYVTHTNELNYDLFNRFMNELIREKDELKKIGLSFNSEGKGKEYGKFLYDKKLFTTSYKKEEIKNYMRGLVTIDSLVEGKATPEDSQQSDGKKEAQNEYVDFETLELEDDLVTKAKIEGYSYAEIEIMFNEFRNYYLSKAKPIKSLPRAWGRWVKNSKNKKENSANKGNAENIILNDDMKEVLTEHKIGEIDGIEIFNDFKNYYLSKGQTRALWKPAFATWVGKDTRYKKEKLAQQSSSKAMRTTEENFYFMKLVSEQIKKIITEQGYAISDIIHKKVVIEEVGFDTYPVPPKFGKGNETLFSWKNQKMQNDAIGSFVTPIVKEETILTLAIEE